MIDLFGSDSDDWEDDDFGADLAEAVEVHCPYCGAGIDLGVDQSGGGECRSTSRTVRCAASR